MIRWNISKVKIFVDDDDDDEDGDTVREEKRDLIDENLGSLYTHLVAGNKTHACISLRRNHTSWNNQEDPGMTAGRHHEDPGFQRRVVRRSSAHTGCDMWRSR